jgi:hypothetical protein
VIFVYWPVLNIFFFLLARVTGKESGFQKASAKPV